jgi:hypothetical protein
MLVAAFLVIVRDGNAANNLLVKREGKTQSLRRSKPTAPVKPGRCHFLPIRSTSPVAHHGGAIFVTRNEE